MNQNTKQNKPEGRNRVIFIIALILLLVINGVLIFWLTQKDRELSETRQDLVTTKDVKEEIERELAEIEQELMGYKQEVLELDTALQSRNLELQEKAEKLQSLLSRHDVTRKELAAAREELGVLRYYTRKYQGQIDSLQNANIRLKEEKDNLAENLANQKRYSDRLKDQNVSLSNRVNMAERLEVSELEATGVRYTAIGDRERSTTRSDRIERLRVCFTVDENNIAQIEDKILYIRVLTPEGSTMQVQEAGSGVFTYRGDETPYTLTYHFRYEQEAHSECIYWGHAPNYPAGEYEVQIYAEGYLIGEQTFNIR